MERESNFGLPNFRSDLIYSSNLPLGQAVENAFVAAAESRRVEEAAMIIHRKILEAYQDKAQDFGFHLLIASCQIPMGPDILMTFLRVTLSGKGNPAVKKERVAVQLYRISAILLQMELGNSPNM